MPTIAIFASGRGSNAKKIIEHFADHPSISVDWVLSNKNDAPVLSMAAGYGIQTKTLSRTEFYQQEEVLRILQGVDLLILAGFLLLIPAYLVRAFPDRILNIHPALLPSYGGKGMYGHHVHQAVIDHKEPFSGISIHLVNERYDEGKILFQATCPVFESDSPSILAQRILKLEHLHYPLVIEQYVDRLHGRKS